MSLPYQIAALFRRDLTRLLQQVQSFSDEAALWKTVPGVANSVGNLVLHLEGNLREYIGRQLGGVSYHRQRDSEFAKTTLPAADLVRRVEAVQELIPRVISTLSREECEALFPEDILGAPGATQQVLISLHGHLNYHLGQIDYLRRVLTGGAAVDYAGL
ncbi:MAG: DUF1572 domain-containing protein [Acidobacteriia bacterium]|nr:DUF1572 domain-containing protein [Terriglobia bacterium]